MTRPAGSRLLAGFALLFGLLSAGCDSKSRGEGQSPGDPDRAREARVTRPGADVESNARDIPERITSSDASAVEAFLPRLSGSGPLVAAIRTTEGTIRCKLNEDEAPVTVSNFVGLATGEHAWTDPATGELQRHEPFYRGLPFHRTIPDFIIQTGSPTGEPDGDPGYTIPDETGSSLRHDEPGTLSMVRHGPHTAGSQFFITLRAAPHLDGRHSVFGRCRPLNVIESIANQPTGADTGTQEPPSIESITFRRRPVAGGDAGVESQPAEVESYDVTAPNGSN